MFWKILILVAFIPRVVWNPTWFVARAVEPTERKAVSFEQSKLRQLFLLEICGAQDFCQMLLVIVLA